MLREFAHHHETGEVMPERLALQMIESKSMFSASVCLTDYHQLLDSAV